MRKRVFCTVTNDLNYDQRMIRICTSLTNAGFLVTLVGRRNRGSLPLADRPYRQHRLAMWAKKGKAFYVEYQIRLFFFLLFRKMDGICAIDLDLILPCYIVSRLRRIPRVYDAHELFCEMQEVVSRPFVHRVWKTVERFAVPGFRAGYTVNAQLAGEFRQLYGVRYAVVRNLPVLDADGDEKEGAADGRAGVAPGGQPLPARYILYQGAVNKGRCSKRLSRRCCKSTPG